MKRISCRVDPRRQRERLACRLHRGLREPTRQQVGQVKRKRLHTITNRNNDYPSPPLRDSELSRVHDVSLHAVPGGAELLDDPRETGITSKPWDVLEQHDARPERPCKTPNLRDQVVSLVVGIELPDRRVPLAWWARLEEGQLAACEAKRLPEGVGVDIANVRFNEPDARMIRTVGRGRVPVRFDSCKHGEPCIGKAPRGSASSGEQIDGCSSRHGSDRRTGFLSAIVDLSALCASASSALLLPNSRPRPSPPGCMRK